MFKSTTLTYRPIENNSEELNLFDQTLQKMEENNLKNEKLEEIINLYNIIDQSSTKLEEQIHYKKNKEFLYTNCNSIKRRFYHYRDDNDHPRITVCILHEIKSNIYSRGISICSFLDQPVKEEGRDRAEDRAIKAIKTKLTTDKISRQEAQGVALILPEEFSKEIDVKFKSAYNVIPTKFELRVFNRPKE